MTKPKYTNTLIEESSPYLLQHAHNPVDWVPWNDETLARAKEENKPMIVSIGYSACHWCHVMEHESFEDEAIARFMNEHFICVKVDREERPDVDQVYMDAVQLMTGRGGWPLNCFTLPDGRPFHGGTYFPKGEWMHVMEQVSNAFHQQRDKVEEYATKLTSGLSEMDEMAIQFVPEKFTDEAFASAVGRWSKNFDHDEGGSKGAPKFPMPNNLSFLLRYSAAMHDEDTRKYVLRTLDKLAFGGIYDQVGGGFARYSTDVIWKVPHFEKMLYDNGQLLSTYAQAFKTSKRPRYQEVIEETVAFIDRALTDLTGAFYSALDADSEGEEGKFYVWTHAEIEKHAGEDLGIIEAYYHIDNRGHWENGNYILMRRGTDDAIAKELNITTEELATTITSFKERLLEARAKRVRPGLDDKSLTSWNAMTVSGLVESYEALGNEHFLTLAKKNLDFLWSQQRKEDGSLWHSYKNGKSSIDGYLEDYAFMIDALIRMHGATLDESYLFKAQELLTKTIELFERNDNGFFAFKSKNDTPLVAQKFEIHDNVIPASNSVLADALHRMGMLFGKPEWLEMADQMLANVEPNYNLYPSGHSQWMSLHLDRSHSYFEVAIVGKDCEEKRKVLAQYSLPGTVLCGSKNESDLPILQGRWSEEKTRIFVCQSGACQLPVETVEEALVRLGRSDLLDR